MNDIDTKEYEKFQDTPDGIAVKLTEVAPIFTPPMDDIDDLEYSKFDNLNQVRIISS